jgi:hypothetical protein
MFWLLPAFPLQGWINLCPFVRGVEEKRHSVRQSEAIHLNEVTRKSDTRETEQFKILKPPGHKVYINEVISEKQTKLTFTLRRTQATEMNTQVNLSEYVIWSVGTEEFQLEM